jgi:Flp pilus assembly pilin Flp
MTRSSTDIDHGTGVQHRVARTARRFAADNSGASAIEYVVLVAFIGLAIMVILAQISGSLNSAFESLSAFISR